MRSKSANKSKKGIGDLLSLVLIIGLSVTLAAIVGNWAIKYSQEFQPEKIAAPELYCDNVRISIEGDCYLQIKNRGSLRIEKLLVRTITKDGETKTDEIAGMMPNQVISIPSCSNGQAQEIEIIPKVKGEKETITCIEKTYIIREEILNKCVCSPQ